jgi:excisionase family DNA binding protein
MAALPSPPVLLGLGAGPHGSSSLAQERNEAVMDMQPKVITIGELSTYLRVHRSTIYRLLKKGELPGFKIGSDWRFNREAIDQWRLQGAVLNEPKAENTN